MPARHRVRAIEARVLERGVIALKHLSRPVIVSNRIDIIEVSRVRETIARTPRFVPNASLPTPSALTAIARPVAANIMPRALRQKKPR